MFMPLTQDTTVHFMSLFDSMTQVQSVDKAVFVFVGDANAHHSEWLESVSPTNRHQHPSGHTVLIHSFHMPKPYQYSLYIVFVYLN